MLSGVDLMELQAATLFCYDADGRMLTVNEKEPDEPAPRVFVGRTADRNIWRFRYDLPDSLIRHLDEILSREPVGANLTEPPATLPHVTRALGEHASVESISIGPAWRFPDEVDSPQGVVAVTGDNLDLLQAHFHWAIGQLVDVSPCRAIAVAGDAVSLCFSSRTSSRAAEAGVVTVEGFRGRGFAAKVVAAWAQAVRASGRIPLYSTSWENRASRAVAAKLGLVQYGADLSVL